EAEAERSDPAPAEVITDGARHLLDALAALRTEMEIRPGNIDDLVLQPGSSKVDPRAPAIVRGPIAATQRKVQAVPPIPFHHRPAEPQFAAVRGGELTGIGTDQPPSGAIGAHVRQQVGIAASDIGN